MIGKPIEHAASVVKEIMKEATHGAIKEYEILPIFNAETGRDTGFSVIFTLSAKFFYLSTEFDAIRKRLRASDYMIVVTRNRLQVRFNVMKRKR